MSQKYRSNNFFIVLMKLVSPSTKGAGVTQNVIVVWAKLRKKGKEKGEKGAESETDLVRRHSTRAVPWRSPSTYFILLVNVSLQHCFTITAEP